MAENPEKESVKVLRECIDLQLKKSNDYQNPNSIIKQSDYYPSGCLTILEIMHAKMLRMRSVMEAMQNDPNYTANFESLEDSAKDLINYASFFVSYSRGEMEGQDRTRDFLNRKPVAAKPDWAKIADEIAKGSVNIDVGGYTNAEDWKSQPMAGQREKDLGLAVFNSNKAETYGAMGNDDRN